MPTLIVPCQGGGVCTALIDSTQTAGDDCGVHSVGAAGGYVLTSLGDGGSYWAPNSGSGAAGYDAQVAAIGNLVSYWRMGAASGNQPDTANNPNGAKDLQLQAGSTSSTYDVAGATPLVDAGVDDGAWEQNLNQNAVSVPLGDADYFSASDATNHRWSFSSLSAFTVAFFFNLRSGWSLPSGELPIIGTDPGNAITTQIEGWAVLVDKTGTIVFGRGGAAASTATLVGPSVPTDTWVHIACSYDGTDMRMYFNGVLVGSQTTGVGVTARDDIRVMGGKWNGAEQGFVYGILDEVVIYSAALTGSQVATLAAATTSPLTYGLVSTTTAYSVTTSDQVVLANGTFNVTLYTAVGNAGRFVTVKNTGTGTVTVVRPTGQTIDGAASNVSLATTKQARTFTSDGAGWQILSGYL